MISHFYGSYSPCFYLATRSKRIALIDCPRRFPDNLQLTILQPSVSLRTALAQSLAAERYSTDNETAPGEVAEWSKAHLC